MRKNEAEMFLSCPPEVEILATPLVWTKLQFPEYIRFKKRGTSYFCPDEKYIGLTVAYILQIYLFKCLINHI